MLSSKLVEYSVSIGSGVKLQFKVAMAAAATVVERVQC